MEQGHTLKYAWKLKTGSPERVLAVLANAIEDTGYRLHNSPSASRFGSEVVGRKLVASTRPRMLILGIIGITIAVALFFNSVPGEKIGSFDIFQIVAGIILCVLGILFALGSTKFYRISLVGKVEKETYMTGGGTVENMVTAQILGNRRAIWVTFDRDRHNRERIPKEKQILEENFNELQLRLDNILPSLIRE
ncbi:MAG: hypothetical protein R6U37_09010 [Dehalococcoidia bacterium]